MLGLDRYCQQDWRTFKYFYRSYYSKEGHGGGGFVYKPAAENACKGRLGLLAGGKEKKMSSTTL